MAEPLDMPAWMALFIGLYALAAGVGELRAPGGWRRMLREIEASPALRLLTGLLCIFAGAVIYLANPRAHAALTDDWLALLIAALAGLTLAEGMLILAAGERYMAFAVRLLGDAGGAWAGFSAFVGFALVAVALARL